MNHIGGVSPFLIPGFKFTTCLENLCWSVARPQSLLTHEAEAALGVHHPVCTGRPGGCGGGEGEKERASWTACCSSSLDRKQDRFNGSLFWVFGPGYKILCDFLSFKNLLFLKNKVFFNDQVGRLRGPNQVLKRRGDRVRRLWVCGVRLWVLVRVGVWGALDGALTDPPCPPRRVQWPPAALPL